MSDEPKTEVDPKVADARAWVAAALQNYAENLPAPAGVAVAEKANACLEILGFRG